MLVTDRIRPVAEHGAGRNTTEWTPGSMMVGQLDVEAETVLHDLEAVARRAPRGWPDEFTAMETGDGHRVIWREGLCDVLLSNPHMFGYCYTQLTDVFQEQNGIYHFDRRTKFDMKRIRAVQQKKAAIEG